MQCCQNLWFLLLTVVLLKTQQSVAKPHNETTVDNVKLISPHSELITQDVIHDKVEMDIKKVIRVNPLELPTLKDDTDATNRDSSLYKIQNVKRYNGQRKYINMQRSRPVNKVDTNLPAASTARAFSLLPSPDKTSKVKHQPKRKNLHFLYNQTDLAGNKLSKSVPVHVAPGAYPVYYIIAKTNGRFGKYPLKSFGSAQDFMKYLHKNKIENMTVLPFTKEEV